MQNEKVSEQVKKVTQAFGFLLAKDANHKMNRLKIVKLLWAADRYHIRNYGRTVSEVPYLAFRHGPVASIALAIARQNSDFELTIGDIEYVSQFLTSDAQDTAMSCSPGEDYLSDTDKEALGFAWHQFGETEAFDLADKISHRYPEWRRFEEYFQNGGRAPKSIDTTDFFKNTEDDKYFRVDAEKLAAAKEIYEENSKISDLLGA